MTFFNKFKYLFKFQVCDIKEDQYYCLDCAVKYLQTRKAVQRKQCKLLYTHSKEEISTIIKNVNRRLEEESDSDSDSDSDCDVNFSTERVSELRSSEDSPKESTRHISKAEKMSVSPPSSTGSVGRPRLSAPNVAPGTSISVNSYSLVSYHIPCCGLDN